MIGALLTMNGKLIGMLRVLLVSGVVGAFAFIAMIPNGATQAQTAATNTPRPAATRAATTAPSVQVTLVITGNPPPPVFNDVLADFGRRLGRAITQADFANTLSSWTWEPKVFADTGLECPAAGATSTAQSTAGYVFSLNLRGLKVEYRASANGQILILCNGGGRFRAGVAQIANQAGTLVARGNTASSGTPGAAATANGICPVSLAGRLTVGKQGRVIPGPANRLRSGPSYSATIIGTIPGGSTFDVIGEAQCDGGSRFWKVRFNGAEGFTAEGEGTTYWLEPAS